MQRDERKKRRKEKLLKINFVVVIERHLALPFGCFTWALVFIFVLFSPAQQRPIETKYLYFSRAHSSDQKQFREIEYFPKLCSCQNRMKTNKREERKVHRVVNARCCNRQQQKRIERKHKTMTNTRRILRK